MDGAANTESTIWQVEVGGKVYEASFDELLVWIDEGALKPYDKVRRGNLRWREANKIPALTNFFNAKQSGQALSQKIVSPAANKHPVENKVSDFENSLALEPKQNFADGKNNSGARIETADQTRNFQAKNKRENLNDPKSFCEIHFDSEAFYVCKKCAKKFCLACPKTFGGNVKICPSCGEMCEPIAEVETSQNKAVQLQNDLREGFGFADFGKALAYPFKFKISLLLGAVLFMFFTLGQSAWAMGGMVLVVAAIFCRMLANTLTFGILANTVENFSRGKIDSNFMPEFEDFEMWDDVIHPFFLSVATYLASFGLLFAVVAGAFYFSAKTDSADSAQALEKIKSIQNQAKNQPSEGAMTVEQAQASRDDAAKEFENLEAEIKKSEAQSPPKSVENSTAASGKFVTNFFGHGKLFSATILAALIWGAFYFPAACLVAGYTRSFTATLNIFVGIDTIKRLGFDYIKVLFFSFLLLLIGGAISYFLSVALSPLDLPPLGNLPAKAIESFAVFYLSAVFSVVLGYALYKNSAKMNFTIS